MLKQKSFLALAEALIALSMKSILKILNFFPGIIAEWGHHFPLTEN
jgi:hypothetical protein